MNAATSKMVYDQIASAVPDAVHLFSVVNVNAGKTYQARGILGNPTTARHLFPGGPGQRYTAGLTCRVDGFKVFEEGKNFDAQAAVTGDEFINDLTGMLLTIGSTEYRVMSVNTTPDGALVRMSLDSADQVGI